MFICCFQCISFNTQSSKINRKGESLDNNAAWCSGNADLWDFSRQRSSRNHEMHKQDKKKLMICSLAASYWSMTAWNYNRGHDTCNLQSGTITFSIDSVTERSHDHGIDISQYLPHHSPPFYERHHESALPANLLFPCESRHFHPESFLKRGKARVQTKWPLWPL